MYEKDENDENNKINLHNYKNILHNKKKNLGLLNQDLLGKKDAKHAFGGGECIKLRADVKGEVEEEEEEEEEEEDDEEEEEEDEDFVAEVEDDDEDEDDEDYVAEGEEEEEDDEDEYDEEDYDDEEREITFNSYNNYYYETYNEEEEKKRNEIEDLIREKQKQDEKHRNGDKKNEALFEKYNKLLTNYKLRKEKNVKDYPVEGEDDSKSCCYSCKSEERENGHTKLGDAIHGERTHLRGDYHPNLEQSGAEEEGNFVADLLNRIEEIYYKESRYESLKSVNNNNNNVCINDLNLNIISDYLNVDISVFNKKTTVLLLGNTQSGKSSFINWFTEGYVQNTSSISKKNQITYVDVKQNFKFNFGRLQNGNYQLGMVNKLSDASTGAGAADDPRTNEYESMGLPQENQKVILSGENCYCLFKPFQKLKKKAQNLKKYIYGKIYYQNNLTKYMNRVNSVSFIDTSGINDVTDFEYDEVVMNLAKYVDLIFIFIDSNTFSINNRLLRIMNYMIDNQINKVTICITRIDLIRKINLYRVVFYLTQYFFRNLNVFKYNLSGTHSNSNCVNAIGELSNEEEHPDACINVKRKQKGGKGNNFFNMSIKSFQNILLIPKMVGNLVARNTANERRKKAYPGHPFNRKNNQGGADVEWEDVEGDKIQWSGGPSFSHLPGHGKKEPPGAPDEEESIFKKILTKSYNSFKEKIMSEDAENPQRGTSQIHQKGNSQHTDEHRDSNKELPFEERKLREDNTSNRLNSIFERKINYGDCLKNCSVFFFVLIYEVITTVYSLLHTSISNYLSTSNMKRVINVEKLYKLDDANKLKCRDTNSNSNNCYKILEFLTIYLPEMPTSLLKRERWKYDEGNINYNHQRRNRFSCDVQYDHTSYNYNIDRMEKNPNMSNDPARNNNYYHSKRYPQRRSIPEDVLLLGKGSNQYDGYNRGGKKVRYPDANNETYRHIDENEQCSYFPKSDYRGDKRDSTFLPQEQTRRRASYLVDHTWENSSANGYPGRVPRQESSEVACGEPCGNPFERPYGYPPRNEEARELNMIHELLFKIDEAIDLKTNQSIYMLKKDLEKIQNSCLQKIFENDEVVKRNKSLRMQNIKFYFFRYMAIFFGFFVSLLRYDLLVYFNFVKPEIFLSIFSKYFLFLSSYNKNSLFIAVNAILLGAYFFVYFRYNRRNYFKSLDKSDLNKLKIILLFTQIIFDEINQLHLRLLGRKGKGDRR
ncbi:conserved Plasmodium protein, unknown function [Plasmodium ovale]|uniref:Dynamin N-terminal domain-containing protein n=1 Tax=Plasmodium ovale TaxID=36330 RepID=A0A1D3TGS2_PLAOA|nr:conserved Plasmodium protein, unknown function [Plasmodium ovale]